MSRNNVEEIGKHAFNQSRKYTLRKLSVGVVSVLIGTTMYVGLAHADTVATGNEPLSSTTSSSSNDNVTNLPGDSSGLVPATDGSNVDRKVISNTNTQQFSSVTVNRLSINSTNQQLENGLQTLLVQAPNNPDWTRNGYYQARASNVDFQLTDTWSSQGPNTELADNVSLGFSQNHHFGIKAHFTVQTSDLKLNNRVYIGSIRLSNSLNDPAHNIALVSSSDPYNVGEFNYQGQYIGHIYEYQLDDSNADFFLKVERTNNFNTPVIDVANWSNKDVYGYNWASAPKYFVNVPNQFTENLTMPGGKTYHFNMYYSYHEVDDWALHSISTQGTHDFNLYDYAYPLFAKNGTTPGQRLNASDFAILNDKNGQGLVVPNTGYATAYSYRPSVNTVHPTGFQVWWSVLVKNKNNKLTNEGLLVRGPYFQYTNAGNGYSLDELKKLCSGNAGVYSLQNDGTYLFYLNLLPSALVMNRDSLIYSLRNRSKIVAMQGNPALSNTLNFYYSEPLGGRSLQILLTNQMRSVPRYDSLTVNNVQLIDPSTSNVLTRYDWHNVPDTLQLSGKAAIRVHYLNGYNGQQIGNSQIFNDDQGKTLSYQAQNLLGAGYSFRRSGSHALLDGQSLPASYALLDGSQKSSITYPKENTVSDVYYVIDPNPEQLVINYYDLAGKLVASKQVAGYTDQRVSLSYSLPAGYVLVTQSQPTSYQFNAGHNELDFVVEPRVTMTVDSRTVTRTIKVQTPDGQMKKVVQTVKFVRNGYLNQVTKQTTYSPWSFGGQYQFSGYQPKPIDGYTVDVAPAVVVTPASSDTMLSLAYHKVPGAYEVHYQLANGKAVANVSVTPGSDGRIQLTAPAGYRLLTSINILRAGFNSQNFVVLVVPDEQTYKVHDLLPSGVKEPLIKTITRTVKITMPNGHVRTVKQAVKFERMATVKADGTVLYSDWQAIGRAQFNQVFVPKRHGYQLVITDASGKILSDVDKIDNVTVAMNDEVVNVKYVKN